MQTLEVFADVACPFAHAELARFHSFRAAHGLVEPVLRVRAWPLELVNGRAFAGPSLVPEIDALRSEVAAGQFEGFDPDGFPATSLPAMAAETAAYRAGTEVGERFSLAIRSALFDHGEDVSNPDVLGRLRDQHGVETPTGADAVTLHADFTDGRQRGVRGSPHFFTRDGVFYCPSMRIAHDGSAYDVSLDAAGFERFTTAVFGRLLA
jgi:predicted DsbA family dithiol-disulfide isomerase